MEDKTVPNNIEAEKAVIGSLLIDNNGISKVADLLIPESFYEIRHQVIFKSMLDLYREGKGIDVLTITTDLKKNKRIQQIGGAAYLSELVSVVPEILNIENYAHLVREAFIRRELIQLSRDINETSREEAKKLEDILDKIESKLFSISISSSDRDFFDTKTLLALQMQRADEYAKNPNGLRGMATGISSIDELTGGLHKSDLIILAARPSVGKSALAFDMARNIGTSGKSVAIFSLEMPAVQVIERMLAQQSRINLWDLRMSQIKDSDYRRFNEAADKISKSKIFIDETPGINVMQLRSKARKLMMEENLDLIVIDYLQLMQGHGRNDSRAQEVGEISRSLKILARELNIPVIALSQLNRAVESRENRQPQLSDLRESGSIEQDADLVIFLARDINSEEIEEREKNAPLKVDFYVAKHRNGPVGKLKLYFHPSHQKYEVYNGD